MILGERYDDALKKLGREYCVFDIRYVSDLRSWSKKSGVDLTEPSQLMKLITDRDDRLAMYVQSEIPEEALDAVLKALSVRWSLKDNVSDPSGRLNSTKKRLAYCFLKEYARTVKGVAGDDLLEDAWVLEAMEKTGLFAE